MNAAHASTVQKLSAVDADHRRGASAAISRFAGRTELEANDWLEERTPVEQSVSAEVQLMAALSIRGRHRQSVLSGELVAMRLTATITLAHSAFVRQ